MDNCNSADENRNKGWNVHGNNKGRVTQVEKFLLNFLIVKIFLLIKFCTKRKFSLPEFPTPSLHITAREKTKISSVAGVILAIIKSFDLNLYE